MALETSQLWEELFEKKNTRREYSFEIDGRHYGPEAVISHSVSRQLFEEFGFGNAATAKLTLKIVAENIPRAATIKRFVCLVNGRQASESLPAGIYFTNRRSEEDGIWNIEAFDVMRKAETAWEPPQSMKFPITMPQAAAEYARLLGCQIDPRTKLNAAYTIDYPPTDTTIRQELQYIAAAHGGNWIVTGEGKLLLVPLGSEPPETHYLITERGKAITLGEVRLLV